MVEIYALSDPRCGSIRYIGKANKSASRLKGHLRDAVRRDTPVYRWIRKLAAQGVVPICKVLHVCADDQWKDAERRLIAEHRQNGAKLLNVAEGGDQPFCSIETRQSNGRKVAKTRHKRFWELKRNLGQAKKDGFLKPETQARLATAGIVV